MRLFGDFLDTKGSDSKENGADQSVSVEEERPNVKQEKRQKGAPTNGSAVADPYAAAVRHYLRGQLDEALEHLERARENGKDLTEVYTVWHKSISSGQISPKLRNSTVSYSNSSLKTPRLSSTPASHCKRVRNSKKPRQRSERLLSSTLSSVKHISEWRVAASSSKTTKVQRLLAKLIWKTIPIPRVRSSGWVLPTNYQRNGKRLSNIISLPWTRTRSRKGC